MGTRAINFDQAHRQLDEFFTHCNHKLNSVKHQTDIKDEKLLLKEELPDIKDEKVWVKHEKESLEADRSTQVLPDTPLLLSLIHISEPTRPY